MLFSEFSKIFQGFDDPLPLMVALTLNFHQKTKTSDHIHYLAAIDTYPTQLRCFVNVRLLKYRRHVWKQWSKRAVSGLKQLVN